jgi:hypothetical protein
MVVGFIITCAISAYHHYSCEFEPRSWRGVLDTTLCDKIRQWFFRVLLISSTNKTNRHDITEISLKVALDTIKPSNHTYLEALVNFVICVQQVIHMELNF